jgi:hypothetical protein
MRTLKEFTVDIVKKPPISFPLIALFHVLWLLWTIWDDRHVPFPGIVWLEVLWMTGYTLFWIGACDLRKWGALGYIFLTLFNASIYLAITNHKIPRDYLSNMFLLDGLFSVFLVFYYKRFR